MASSANGPDFGANSREEAMARHELTRRAVLRYGIAGVGTLGVSALLAACGSGNSSRATSSAATSAAATSYQGGHLPARRRRQPRHQRCKFVGWRPRLLGQPAASAAGSGALCASSTAVTGKPGGTINLVRAQDSIGFDKTMVFSNASIWVYVNFWETLTIGSADGTKVEPWLAEVVGPSPPTNLTWTFHLKEGASRSPTAPR